MIICRLYQTIASSHVDDGTRLPTWTQRHLNNCPRCREFYQSALAITKELSTRTEGDRRSPSPFLHAKVMSAIRSEANAAFEPRPSRRRSAGVLVLGTACLLLLAGILWVRHPAITGQHPSTSTPAPADVAFNVQLPSAAQVNQWTTALDKPLEKETQLVLNDAKSALNSLKNSFLPEAEEGLPDRPN